MRADAAEVVVLAIADARVVLWGTVPVTRSMWKDLESCYSSDDIEAIGRIKSSDDYYYVIGVRKSDGALVRYVAFEDDNTSRWFARRDAVKYELPALYDRITRGETLTAADTERRAQLERWQVENAKEDAEEKAAKAWYDALPVVLLP